jgi:hypothetical protein
MGNATFIVGTLRPTCLTPFLDDLVFLPPLLGLPSSIWVFLFSSKEPIAEIGFLSWRNSRISFRPGGSPGATLLARLFSSNLCSTVSPYSNSLSSLLPPTSSERWRRSFANSFGTVANRMRKRFL